MEENRKKLEEEGQEQRREFLSKIGKTALAAPAVTVLLSAEAKRGVALAMYAE